MIFVMRKKFEIKFGMSSGDIQLRTGVTCRQDVPMQFPYIIKDNVA